MTKPEAISLIDRINRQIIDPVEMLHLVWLRVILTEIPKKDWEVYVEKAAEVLSH